MSRLLQQIRDSKSEMNPDFKGVIKASTTIYKYLSLAAVAPCSLSRLVTRAVDDNKRKGANKRDQFRPTTCLFFPSKLFRIAYFFHLFASEGGTTSEGGGVGVVSGDSNCLVENSNYSAVNIAQ